MNEFDSIKLALEGKPIEFITDKLDETLEDIVLLDSIILRHFSSELKDVAHKERHKLFQIASACYSIFTKREDEDER